MIGNDQREVSKEPPFRPAQTQVGLQQTLDAESVDAAHELKCREEVCAHYRDTLENYRWWSPEGHLHFGYWRWPMNPFARNAMLEEMNNQVFSKLRLDRLEAGKVVDLGCGVGGATRFGSQRYPKLQWSGVNVSVDQLADARSRTTNEAISYHCVDYHRLPWDDSSFDGAFYMESLCYSLRPAEALAEASRILRPGARVVITDGFLRRNLESTSNLFRQLYYGVTRNWAVPNYHTITQVDSWSERTGMRLIELRNLGWRLAPTAFHSVPLTMLSYARLMTSRRQTRWRWQQLAACRMSLWLGLHRRSFGYYLIVLEK